MDGEAIKVDKKSQRVGFKMLDRYLDSGLFYYDRFYYYSSLFFVWLNRLIFATFLSYGSILFYTSQSFSLEF